MEIYKWKWMVLGALGCVNNADFERKLVNDNIMLDVFYYLSEITTRTSNLINTVLVLIGLQSNPPKRPQSADNDVEGVDTSGFTVCKF